VNYNYEIFLIIANYGQKKPFFQFNTLNIGNYFIQLCEFSFGI